MIVGVEIGFNTQNSEVGIIPGLAYTQVYADYAEGMNEWCRSYNDLIEEVIAVGGEICYNKMHLEMGGAEANVWMIQWREVDGHLNRREVHYTSTCVVDSQKEKQKTTSINDGYGRGGFAYLEDTADYQSLKHDPMTFYFKDGIEDVAHLYPVIQTYNPNIQDSLALHEKVKPNSQ